MFSVRKPRPSASVSSVKSMDQRISRAVGVGKGTRSPTRQALASAAAHLKAGGAIQAIQRVCGSRRVPSRREQDVQPAIAEATASGGVGVQIRHELLRRVREPSLIAPGHRCVRGGRCAEFTGHIRRFPCPVSIISLTGSCSLCRNVQQRTVARDRFEAQRRAEREALEQRKLERRAIQLWREHLREGLQKAQMWGTQAEGLRTMMRQALASDHLPDVRKAAQRYDAFRKGSPEVQVPGGERNPKRRDVRGYHSTNTQAPPTPAAPPGCSVRPEERWGPWSGSFIRSAGRAESRRGKH